MNVTNNLLMFSVVINPILLSAAMLNVIKLGVVVPFFNRLKTFWNWYCHILFDWRIIFYVGWAGITFWIDFWLKPSVIRDFKLSSYFGGKHIFWKKILLKNENQQISHFYRFKTLIGWCLLMSHFLWLQLNQPVLALN